MKKYNSFITGITMGCPAGIGPQIILKAYKKKLIEKNSSIVLGDLSVLQFYNKKFGYNLSFNVINEISCKKK